MEQAYALELSRNGVQVALMVVLPMLAVSLFIGLLISIFQSVTSIQETTLTFVPKLLGIAAVLTFMGSWMLTQLVGFTEICFRHISSVGHF